MQHETYERGGDTNTDYGNYLGEVEKLICMDLYEKYFEVAVSIDE